MKWVPVRRAKKRRRRAIDRQKKQQRSYVARINVVYGLIFLSFASLIVRLGYLQITQGAYYRTQAMTTSVEKIPVLPARGRIYDINGNLLAYDQPSYSVFLTQMKGVDQNMDQIAQILAPVFNTTQQKILQTISSQSGYATVLLFKNIKDNQLAFVAEHQSELPGVSVEMDSQREYPYKTLAGHVLGYISPITAQNLAHYQKLGYLMNQKVGQTGLEYEYEKLLQGTVGDQLLQVNIHGTSMKDLGYDPAPTAGNNLQLTLDGHMQAVAQNEIMRVVNSSHSGKITDASAVAIDVKTGGVLAMVSYPYVDPNWYTTPGLLNKYTKYLGTPGIQFNSAIQSPSEPGSTVKPSTLMAGLKYGAIPPNQQFYSGGYIYVSSQRLADDRAFGYINAVMGITESSEVYFYQVGLLLGHWFGSSTTSGGGSGLPYRTWSTKYFSKGLLDMFHTEWEFGLGQVTGVDLPNEVGGRFYYQDYYKNFNEVQFNLPQEWNQLQKQGSLPMYSTPVTLALAATGQMQYFTPMELAQYVATIANNGVRIQPHLLQAVYPPGMSQQLNLKEKPIRFVNPHVQNKVSIKPSYIQLAQQGMKGVIENPSGTGYGAFVGAPYTAAGKTGTPQIVENGQIVDSSVFIAYAPFNNPQIAVAVVVPRGGYGATAAAPIARKLIDTYFKEHHEFYKNPKQWESTAIPSNWEMTPAYKVPESQKN